MARSEALQSWMARLEPSNFTLFAGEKGHCMPLHFFRNISHGCIRDFPLDWMKILDFRKFSKWTDLHQFIFSSGDEHEVTDNEEEYGGGI